MDHKGSQQQVPSIIVFRFLLYLIPARPAQISASTVLLPTKSSCKVSIKLFMLFFFSCSSVPVYFVWLKYISWFMYGFEALIINQWKDYGPICMYHFFPVRMSVIRVVVLIKKLHFVQMYLCNSFCHTMDCVWVSASSVASETSPRLPLPTSVSSVSGLRSSPRRDFGENRGLFSRTTASNRA